jgi:hypothetical protein
MKEPKPTTELWIAKLIEMGLTLTIHAKSILSSIQVAHVRIISHADVKENFPGAGDTEGFYFGLTKFITLEEAKQVLINTFVRPRESGNETNLQPVILVGHTVENEFEHLQCAFGVNLCNDGTIVKVIDTQLMAQELNIKAPRGLSPASKIFSHTSMS